MYSNRTDSDQVRCCADAAPHRQRTRTRTRTRRRRWDIGVLAVAVAAAVLSAQTVAAADPAPAALAPVPSAGCANPATAPGETNQPFTAAGRTGNFIQDVPPAPAGTPLPVVFDMHGYLQPAWMQRQWSGVGEYGMNHGYATISPETTAFPPKWDYTPGGGDIAYLSELLNHVEQTLCVDRRRVYMTGLSMGGFTSSAVACQLADRFAAVAPVAGLENFSWCQPTRHIPIVAFHGTGDQIVSYTGGLGPIGQNLPATDGSARTAGQQLRETPPGLVLSEQSVPDQAAAWAARNGCGSAPAVDRVTTDVTRTVYPCATDSSVELYTIEGGGHTWPGGNTTTVPEPIVGRVTNTISATQVIWDFFRAHPLDTPS